MPKTLHVSQKYAFAFPFRPDTSCFFLQLVSMPRIPHLIHFFLFDREFGSLAFVAGVEPSSLESDTEHKMEFEVRLPVGLKVKIA